MVKRVEESERTLDTLHNVLESNTLFFVAVRADAPVSHSSDNCPTEAKKRGKNIFTKKKKKKTLASLRVTEMFGDRHSVTHRRKQDKKGFCSARPRECHWMDILFLMSFSNSHLCFFFFAPLLFPHWHYFFSIHIRSDARMAIDGVRPSKRCTSPVSYS